MARRRPRWYFSFRSPYSWLAYRDLISRYQDVAELIDWLPFWEPDPRSEQMLTEAGGEFHYVAMSRAKHLYILQDTRRLTSERGLAMVWPVDKDPCWEVSHLAYLVAEAEGRGRDYIDLVYRARWEQGRDICDRATIAAIATELDLDPDRLAGACDDAAVRERGLAALLTSDRDGVFGVPFFIDGYDRYWGVDRLPGFVASVRARYDQTLAPAADAGHAGGCG